MSVEALAIAAFLGLLVLHQRLSYFHTVRYLFLFAYMSFAVIVASELALSFTLSVNTASNLLKLEITAVLTASVLLGIASAVLYLQAKHKSSPYMELIRKPPPGLVFTIAYNVGALILVWTVFSFQFEVSEKLISGKEVLFPKPTGPEFAVLGVVLFGFVWNQLKLLSKTITVGHPEALAKVIRRTGFLWIILAGILFTFNGIFRFAGINLVEIGHLLDSLVLGYLAYEYTRPTALMEFFHSNSHLAMQIKKQNFSRIMSFATDDPPHKKILFEVDSLSNCSELVSYFLGSGPGPAVLITYEGSRLVTNLRDPVKTIELSLSAEKMVVASNDKMTAGLNSKSVYQVLKWAIESNPGGKLVLDGITHFIVLLGVDEVYSLITYASELCAKHDSELLLIVTKQAHSRDILAVLEGMSDYVIDFEKNSAIQIKPQGHTSIIVP
ncbi:MAG: hypothetical protein IH932_04595 [Thaumarchaeota archaeon]|nr:hypothetical protein [Nitrososphaerota archaeon]